MSEDVAVAFAQAGENTHCESVKPEPQKRELWCRAAALQDGFIVAVEQGDDEWTLEMRRSFGPEKTVEAATTIGNLTMTPGGSSSFTTAQMQRRMNEYFCPSLDHGTRQPGHFIGYLAEARKAAKSEPTLAPAAGMSRLDMCASNNFC